MQENPLEDNDTSYSKQDYINAANDMLQKSDAFYLFAVNEGNNLLGLNMNLSDAQLLDILESAIERIKKKS